jgi:hypothetical protein
LSCAVREHRVFRQSRVPHLRGGRVVAFARFISSTGVIVETLEGAINLKEVSREEKIDSEAPSQLIMTGTLRPGHYRLDVAVRDVNSNRLGTMSRLVIVPGDGPQRVE